MLFMPHSIFRNTSPRVTNMYIDPFEYFMVPLQMKAAETSKPVLASVNDF